MKRLLAAAGLTVTLLVPAGPAFAFHHSPTLPDCGEGGVVSHEHAAGALANNPAQDLPLPPAGTPADTTDGTRADGARATQNCS